MSKTVGNEPANALDVSHGGYAMHLGLTKREYFAAMANENMAAMALKDLSDVKELCEALDIEYKAESALDAIVIKMRINSALSVIKADELIKALNKEVGD